MPDGWKILPLKVQGRPNLDRAQVLAVAHDHCEAYPKLNFRCRAKATEVAEWVVEGSGTHQIKRAAFCEECRRKCLGKTAAELRSVRRAFEARQLVAFPDEPAAKR